MHRSRSRLIALRLIVHVDIGGSGRVWQVPAMHTCASAQLEGLRAHAPPRLIAPQLA